MVAMTPGGGTHHHGRTPTMTIKPGLYMAGLLAYASLNVIVAVDTVLPSGSGQVWAAARVTAVAAAAGGLLLRNVRANKQLVDQYIALLEDERHAHRETRQELQDATKRLARLERTVTRIERDS